MSDREYALAPERPKRSLYNKEYFIYINILKNEFKTKKLEDEIKK